MAIEEAPRREPAPSADPAAAAVTRAAFALVSALSFLALLFLFGYVYMREVGHTETEKFVLQALQAQKANLQTGLGTLADLSRDLENSRKEARSNEAEMGMKIGRVRAGLANMAGIVELLERRVSAQQQVLDRLPPVVPVAPRPAEVKKQ